LFSSPDTRVIKSRRIRWAWSKELIGKLRDTYTIFVETSEGKRQLERPRRRWKNNVRVWTEFV